MNGIMKLPLARGRYYVVIGGPYRSRTKGTVGVKMAVEIKDPCEISIPTRDFSTPSVGDVDAGLRQAVSRLMDGEQLYVGCMGGYGRTGLFLSILAKAFKVSNDPVAYVRAVYSPRAVETGEQERFVASYAVPWDVQVKVRWAKIMSLFSAQSLNQTRPVADRLAAFKRA